MTEQPLDGGIANAGQVFRSGPHVLRPSSPHTGSIHAFLRAVERSGFDGAPRAIGVDDDGRERLTYVEGDVPSVPYPPWCQTDEALASLGRLLRGLHDAAPDFDGVGYGWDTTLADPLGGSVLCHNDAEPANVVFRAGRAVALIDFEFAAPGRPVYDLAHLARFWVPLDHEVDQARVGFPAGVRPERLRLLVDAYGLDAAGRTELLPAIDDAFERIESATARGVADGNPGVTELWNRTGGAERFARRHRWWARHRDRFASALR